MKEVSCDALTVIFKDMERNSLPLDILCRNIPYDLDFLRNKKENIEWDVYCKIMNETRAVYRDDQDYIRLGIQTVEWRVLPVLSAMVGFFLNPIQVYRLSTDTRKGVGTQYFRCITTTTKEFSKHHLEILLELPESFPYCKEFFLITKGFFIAAPRLLKLRDSNVIMQATDRGALYDITIPRRSSMFSWIRQLLSLPSSNKAAILELNETYALLYDRYQQLEKSKIQIQKQAKQLETAYSISQLIRSDLDLDFTLKAVAESLIATAGFAAVEIKINSTIDQELIERDISLGQAPSIATQLSRTLDGHGKTVGEINLWLHPDASVEETQQLLDYIIPTITMEILNALSFKLVTDYRSRLESKVDEIQDAILEERRRISGELHDDLGTNLSAIALMSGVMRDRITGAGFEKISVAAQQSLETISEIVWSLNPRNDKLGNLLSYMRKYAVEYFELSKIKCQVKVSDEIPDITVKGEQRRNIFLCVKEALHNVMKHSEATTVQLSFLIMNNNLEIIIHDNGKGIDVSTLSIFGNGLQNMEQRMRSAGGSFEIKINNGTELHLRLLFDNG